MTALRYKVVDDYGAYFQYGLGTHGNGFSQTVGPYKIRAVGAEIYAVFTNKCQQGACRGFGSEVTNFMIERIVDAAVDELGLDPIAVPARQFHPAGRVSLSDPDRQPLRQRQLSRRARHGAADARLRELARQAAAMRTQGRYVGIGVASCQEKGVFSADRVLDAQPRSRVSR